MTTTKAARIRVMVVDDSVVIRQVVCDALRGDAGIEIAGQAQNGRVALEKLLTTQVDVITLDLEMPEMDGLTTLNELKKLHPKIPVVVFSTLTERGASATLEALSRGASDYVCKPSGQRNLTTTMEKIREELIPKIRALHTRAQMKFGAVKPPPMAAPIGQSIPPGPVQLIVIGVSTGGPAALAEVIPRLPANLPQPVLIVQHMPATFTRVLAERLNGTSKLRVREATHQERIVPGRVYIAPGDNHMRVAGSPREAWLTLDKGQAENGCRPAADPLFTTAAQVFGAGVMGVVMTGLGHDATKGAAAIRKVGGHIWVQDEASATVWGMPGSIVQAGYATRILPLTQIAR
ncbi:MAG TPA: chemotaxis response regulator protein-glutamate methylesterase, partial [Polyangiales bacterium]|nr:chemotaxis response regulator protein-glutamate methylesterase [Polyangiales bacterium]